MNVRMWTYGDRGRKHAADSLRRLQDAKKKLQVQILAEKRLTEEYKRVFMIVVDKLVEELSKEEAADCILALVEDKVGRYLERLAFRAGYFSFHPTREPENVRSGSVTRTRRQTRASWIARSSGGGAVAGSGSEFCE